MKRRQPTPPAGPAMVLPPGAPLTAVPGYEYAPAIVQHPGTARECFWIDGLSWLYLQVDKAGYRPKAGR